MRSQTLASLASLFLASLSTAAASQSAKDGPEIEPVMVRFDEAGFSGPGAQLLTDSLEHTQFIVIGESHGHADAARLVKAFAAEAKPHGFDNYAIEVGTFSAAWLRSALVESGPDGLASQLQGRPLAVPFLNSVEEAAAATLFLNEGQLWGVDQEFIGSPAIHFEALEAMDTADPDHFAALAAAEKAAFQKGDQSALFLARATSADWSALQKAAGENEEALELVSALKASSKIYRLFFTGRRLDSNLDRIALIRSNFLTLYRAAKVGADDAPRVIMKFGALHAGKSTSSVSTFDLGSLVEGMAAANDLGTRHIAYMPIGGKARIIRPSPQGFFSERAVNEELLVAALEKAGVDIAKIRSARDHYVIDLDRVRRALGDRGLGELDANTRFTVLGFDYLVTTNEASPATPLAQR